MKLTRFIPFILLALLLAAGCCGGYPVHTDETNGFAVSYPPDWEIAAEGLWEEEDVIHLRAAVSCGPFVPSFDIKKMELSPSMSLETWFEEQKGNLTALDGYTFVSEEELTVAGLDAVKYVFTFDVYGVAVEVMQVYLVADMMGWLMTCRCAPECWSECQPIFDTAAASFQLLD